MRIRRLLALTLAAVQGLGIGTVWANPLDPVVVNGRATFDNNGNTLTISNTPGTIIHWGSFNIAGNEITRFVQDSAASAVLNRIGGQDPSVILGALQSNGHVFLVNPNGVVFGQGARVDVNGLIASSLDIANDDFRAERLDFRAGNANPGAVRNDGAITTPGGGRVYLIAPSVENSGLIASPQGEVVLAAGREVQLVDSRNPDLHVVASAPADRALNLGRILSHGGSVGIYGALINQRGVVDADSATVGENGRIVFRASDTTLLEAGSTTTARGAGAGGTVHVLGDHVGITGDASIDASGRTGGGTVLVGGDYRGLNPAIANASAAYVGAQTSIRADATGSGDGGRVIVYSSGPTRAYGRISARGGEASGNGGFAEVSGASYLDYRGRTDLRAANGSAGTLLLDPNDITIQAGPAEGSTVNWPGASYTFSGGTGSSILTTTDLESALSFGNVTVSTSEGTGGPMGGHITVANGFGWTNGNSLTLDADNGISINGAITANSDGRLLLVSRGGSITQTAPINTTYLGIDSLGDVNLTGATNFVNVLAARVGDATHPNHNFSFLNGMTFMVGSVGGLTGISLATSGGYSAGSPDGVVSLRTTSGDILQNENAIISAKAANLEADHVILEAANDVGVVSGFATGANATARAPADGGAARYFPTGNAFSFTSQGDLTVGSVAGRSGISAASGDVTLTSNAGSLALSNAATAGNGGVYLNANQGAITGSATGLAVTASAAAGIALTTQAQEVSAYTSAAASDITVANTGPLTVNAVSNAGSGAISISTSGPLTVAGGITSGANGAVTLSAGPTGAATDDLTINGNITSQVDSGGAIETGGPVLLRAGDTITVNGTIAGNVTQQPFLNTPPPAGPPTIDQCIANPSLAGCAQVLPSINTCTASPSTYGCTAVLPTLAQCVALPSTYGCTAVLPSFEQCTASPTTAGCSVVLPTMEQCSASPTLPGCSVVLPTLQACIATPWIQGCAAVLPSIPQCTADPSRPGCSVVFPTLDQCVANPSLAGCSSVLPSLQSCIATPNLPGCERVLEPLNACIANPTGAGCDRVLPSYATCASNPTVLGCDAVLGLMFQSCLAQPSRAECAGVLPTISQCELDRTRPGCSAVLPTMSQCIASPALQGCSAILPRLEQCAANPNLQGCEAVLPRPDFCGTHPADPRCAIFGGGSSVTSDGKKPVDQVVDTTITLINNGTGSVSTTKPTGKNPPTEPTGDKDEKPATKLYCN